MPAARAGVDVVHALLGEGRVAALVIVEVRVAPVDDRVGRLEMLISSAIWASVASPPGP